jgi:hypothetical protein
MEIRFSSTGYPISRRRVITLSRVIPGRIVPLKDGVTTWFLSTKKTFMTPLSST